MRFKRKFISERALFNEILWCDIKNYFYENFVSNHCEMSNMRNSGI